MTLHVLVLETERGAADAAVGELEAAGHEVLRCHEPGAPAFPCKGIGDDPRCPLRNHTVDVALTVRPRPRSQPAPQEDGVACALERHVPLVVAGPSVLNPYEAYATEVLDRTYDVVDACERAAAAPMRAHASRAGRALRDVLQLRGVAGGVPRVQVHRRDGRLLVEVTGAHNLDQHTKSVGAVRMIGALRELDRDAAGIDVVFT